MVQNELTSGSVISIPNLGGMYHNGFREIMSVPEFRKHIVYRKFDLNYDNVTGDIDKTSYEDYSIIAALYITDITFRKTHAGELQTADGELFLPARVNKDTDDENISPEFRPSIDDNIYWMGVWYNIINIEFFKIGSTEVYCVCKLKKFDNTYPDFKWNKEYKTLPQIQGYGGFS